MPKASKGWGGAGGVSSGIPDARPAPAEDAQALLDSLEGSVQAGAGFLSALAGTARAEAAVSYHGARRYACLFATSLILGGLTLLSLEALIVVLVAPLTSWAAAILGVFIINSIALAILVWRLASLGSELTLPRTRALLETTRDSETRQNIRRNEEDQKDTHAHATT